MIKADSHNHGSAKNRPKTQLSGKLDKNLVSYVAAATAAGVGVVTGTMPAQAKVVYTPANVKLGSSFVLDLNHDGIADYTFTNTHGAFCFGQFCTTNRVHPLRPQSQGSESFGKLMVYGLSGNQVWGQGTGASALSGGVFVGSKGKFPGGDLMVKAFDIDGMVEGLQVQGPWREFSTTWGPSTLKNHYLGFKFFINGQTHYGWARFNVSVTPGAYVQATLTGYAYETQPDTPIPTIGFSISENRISPEQVIPARPEGATPTPASLGLLAAGVDGLPVWRKRKA